MMLIQLRFERLGGNSMQNEVNTMRGEHTLVQQILKLLPWGAFDRLVNKHEADKGVSVLSTKSQFVTMVVGQLAGADSLRAVTGHMASQSASLYHLGVRAPKRSTLADANRDRPADVFCGMFEAVLALATSGQRNGARAAVRLIDSSSLALNKLATDWASYDAHVPGAKMHVVYDPLADRPVYFAVTPQRINDITAAHAMPIEPGATYVFDLGYYEFDWWQTFDDAGCRYVTRLKSNTRTTLVTERAVPEAPDPLPPGQGMVLADRVVEVAGRLKNRRQHPLSGQHLREVHVRIPTGKILRLISNDLTATAQEIADLYKLRWQIELFFRWVKQTLRIKKFVGTSENAVRIQIAVALIVYLLLRMAQSRQVAIPSPLDFARLIRANLWQRRSLAHLAHPKPPPSRKKPVGQLTLALT
jgi:hypothetical protein